MPFCPDTDALEDTNIVVQKQAVVPNMFPLSGPKSFHLSANSLDSCGISGIVYLTFGGSDVGIAAPSAGWWIDPESVVDAETIALVSDVTFMGLLEKAETDIAEGHGVSGDELRGRRP